MLHGLRSLIAAPLLFSAIAAPLSGGLLSEPAHADTRIFSVETDRPGVTITAVSRNGQSLAKSGESGARTFFQIDAGSDAVPCSNQLAFTASNGQRLEYIVDLCAHNWQVKLPLGTAQAPSTPTPPPSIAPTSITVYTNDQNVGIDEVVLDKQPMTIGTRQGNAVAIALPPGSTKCERDLGLVLSDGRRIARMVDICANNGVVLVTVDGDTSSTPPPPQIAAPPPVTPPPPVAAAPTPPAPVAPPPPVSSGEVTVIDGLVWESRTTGSRPTLVYALPNSDQIEFEASCNRGQGQVDVSLDRTAPEVQPGASVPVTFTAGTFAKTFTATGSDINALTGVSHPEMSIPLGDPFWPALVKESYLVIQIGSAGPYALSLRGSSAAARPFLATCETYAPPGQAAFPPGQAAPPVSAGPVGGDYACSEEPQLRSQRSSIETRLIFRNDLAQPVQLFWLDYDGARRAYLSLEPGETGVQPTFFSHPWVVADLSGRCLAIYYGRRNDTEVAIGR